MNLKDCIEKQDKPVIAKNILKENSRATLLQLKKGGILQAHQSMTNAMLVLLSGKATYEEDERKVVLSNELDFLYITKHITHKVLGEEDSLLLLIQ